MFILPGIAHAAPAAKPKAAAKPAAKSPAKPKPAALQLSPTDPQRFFKVKEWKGALETSAQSSGERTDGDATVTYNSSIRVVGRFKLAPHIDTRNVDELSWRGKGEAHIQVSGRRKALYPDEIITDTWVGDYIDTFSVEISNIDVQKGQYQMAVIRDLWQEQPHKGQAIQHTEVKVNRYGSWTRTEMSPGHSWPDDGGAGFGRESPLPKKGFIINGSMTSNNNDFLSQDGGRWNTTWTIQPSGPEFEEPLKAIAGGPYVAERGQTLNLDGWNSTGKIISYKWTFAPADEKSEIPFNAGAAKEGRRVPTVFLAPVKATLTVSDGKKEDSDTVTIEVKARDYKTPFIHREGEELHPESIPPRMIKGRDLKYAGGENVCALENYGDKNTIHILHPNEKGGSWESNGYVLQQVQDAGGPFDGDWYITDYTIRIERQTLINKYILPGGPPPVRTAKPFYETNQAMGNDVDAYLAAVRKHELLHSELMQKALNANDPGPKIEAFAGKDKDAIKALADKEIQASETAIDKASADPLPSVGFEGKIAFPDDATDKYISMDMAI